MAWKDGGAAPSPFALPPNARPGLGQVVRLADGTLVVSQFGHGESGAVILVPAEGQPRAISGVDPRRRRLGLAPAAPGAVYSAWFTKDGEAQAGGLSVVAVAGGERDVKLAGLERPIGLAVSGDFLYVSDQSAGAILRCPAKSCTKLEPVAKLTSPDLLAPAPGGAVLAGSKAGGVALVCPDGRIQTVISTGGPTRGVAYDPSGRLFFVEKGVLRSVGVQVGCKK